jgi:pimeloyl-ACP methyl ester carboxylesterase
LPGAVFRAPHCRRRPRGPWARESAAGTHFFKTCESSFDFGAALARVTAPVLILGGDEDPVMPPAFQDELEAALISAPVRRVRFANAGHFIHADAPDEYFAALREFILDVTTSS